MTLSRRSTTRQQGNPTSPTTPCLTSQTESGSSTTATVHGTGTSTANKTSEDESSDDNAVTRCPCGKEKLPYLYDNDMDDGDEGLMVQCDQCEVWQHCKCVGLEEEKDIPDQYYCEQCRPENHKSVKSAHGRRFKRFYSSVGFTQDPSQDPVIVNKPAKRRKKTSEPSGSRKSSRHTPNKQKETSSALVDQEVTSASPSPLFNDNNDNNKNNKNLEGTVIENGTSDVDEVRITRSKRSVYSPVAESLEMITPSSTASTRRKKPSTTPNGTSHLNTHATVILSTLTASPTSLTSTTHSLPTSGKRSSHISSPTRNAQGRFHKTDSRASTPHPTTSGFMPTMSPSSSSSSTTTTTTIHTTNVRRDDTSGSYWNEDGLPSREGSPPARVKYPNPKMTMADMNKRAKQIMDHINKMKSTFQQQQEEKTSTTTSTTTTTITTATLIDSGSTTTVYKATADNTEHYSGSVPPMYINSNTSATSSACHSTLFATNSDDDTDNTIDNEEEERPRSYSTSSVSSSISSASTVPLLLDDDDDRHTSSSSLMLSTGSPTSPMPLNKLFLEKQESSLDMMDRVYRDLLKFQRKFGRIFQGHQASSSVR
ncbi:uncharacterized protein BX664DRAFT_322010 [Halteromyces radiatus]|uniref:uncharacterized protein n=1 Tax=Halteromyces radiatus TaxID=101107 RepID=UPI00221EEF04|nr:uncharacterized protein BX664DRAFT_322010 [Halteromyces radiatus]KAI8099737.1 hypothetical protein BX664DRAFT_322010 [Halteromyces radiatus]